MEPVEINAGAYYLRAMRDDPRLDDRPRLLAGFDDPVSRHFLPHIKVHDLESAGHYIAERAKNWAEETRFSWAVAEPTTGLFMGEVLLKDLDLDRGTAEAGCWAHPEGRGKGMTTTAVAAMLRFGFGALGLREVRWVHRPDNTASARVGAKVGFTPLSDTDNGDIVLILRNAAVDADGK
ncbi:GNAT family N-acetyltransferase [Actinokineospora sp. NBRC 105648]|uniref:GNAT family N-acetyltransferase n=1 Tax=Actinokineospora sp. NBRC 105648 TaxID=3032206 RepID=UPI0025569EE2|nr:GNAT family N-acetyltransferase [Actinokineospora sp. NBRC 105648]